MPKARIPPRSTGPVKATSTAANKNITPAWTGMIGVPEAPSSKAFVYADNDDDEDDDNLSIHLRSDAHSISKNSINSIRNSNTGFNLKNSMNALNLNQFVETSDMIFQKRNPLNNSSLLFSENIKKRQELGPIEPNISSEFEKLVLSGNYVDFSQVALLIGHASNLEQSEALLKRDILAWLDCFMIYLLVVSSNCPGRVPNLLRYSRIVLWIYKEAPDNSAWWRYDKAYRRMAAVKGNNDWSSIEEEMFSGAASEKFRLTLHCVECLTNNHLNVKCPFRTNTFVKNPTNPTPVRITPLKPENTDSPQRNDQIEKALANPEKSARKPQEGLQLKYAFGYHGYNSCNNLFYTQSNEIVFHTAGVGVIYNQQTHEQRFYMGHDDDILCLTIQDDHDVIATGQIGRQPCTHVWDIVSLKTVSVLKGFHKRGIICVDFSGDGEMLADVGLDDDHCICIWNWKKQEKLATTRGHKDVIYNLEWNPYEVNKFASVGVKHIKFWTIVDRS